MKSSKSVSFNLDFNDQLVAKTLKIRDKLKSILFKRTPPEVNLQVFDYEVTDSIENESVSPVSSLYNDSTAENSPELSIRTMSPIHKEVVYINYNMFIY